MDCSLPGSTGPWDFPGKNTRVVCHFLSPGDLPDPGIKPGSPTLQVDSLLPELPGKPLRKCESVSHSVMSNSMRPHEL